MNATLEYRPLNIDFMYIDLTTCGRCLGTEQALDAAIEVVAPVLAALGLEPVLRKTLVRSEAQASALAFRSSPTIRVDGSDVANRLVESSCTECGDVCGEDTDCRVWLWRGGEYTTAPKGMLVEAIVGAALSEHERKSGAPERSAFTLPDNLVRFFAAKARSERRGAEREATKSEADEPNQSANKPEPRCAPGCCS